MASCRTLIPIIILLEWFVAHAAQCDPRGFAVPVKSNTISNGAQVRGVSLLVGSENESLSLLPSAFLNYTYIYAAESCPQDDPFTGQCYAIRGGGFNRNLSSTITRGKDEPRVFDGIYASWTKDTIDLSNGTSSIANIEEFEFGVRENGAQLGEINQNQLGLGRASNFLETLWSSGLITSKSYSFFFGTPNEISATPRDGFMSFGAYDKGFVGEAKNLTKPFSLAVRNPAQDTLAVDQSGCKEGMLIDITGLDLTWGNGSVNSILDEPLQACIVTEWSDVARLPVKYWNALSSTVGFKQPAPRASSNESNGLYYGTQIIDHASSNFDGTFTITLENTLSVTIPNDHFMFPEPRFQNDGTISKDANAVNIPIDTVSNQSDTTYWQPSLGMLFFSHAYLYVNHDKNEFTLWAVEANTTKKQLFGADTNNDCVAEITTNSSITSITTNSSTTGIPADTTDGNPPKSDDGVSGGTIAGIVIGALAGIAAIAAVALLVLHRKKKQRMALEAVSPSYDYGKPQVGYVYPMEMQSDSNPAEMAVLGPHFYAEMPGAEVSAEAPDRSHR